MEMRRAGDCRLLKRLQETLGDEATDDLFAWFDEAGWVNRSAVREIADLYFDRFDTRLESGLSGLRTELTARLEAEVSQLRVEFTARLEQRLADTRADLMLAHLQGAQRKDGGEDPDDPESHHDL